MKLLLALLVLFYSFLVCAKRKSSGGVYVYSNKQTGRAEYVGTTNNFDRRHKEHVRENHYYTNNKYDYTTYEMNKSTIEQRYQAERDLIKELNPKANKSKGGNGPR